MGAPHRQGKKIYQDNRGQRTPHTGPRPKAWQ
ncbi:unnamed protein product [Plutella xylostella]|uniref:(diamondback moth) hypothetical protein n=1 Tax=Plutella xylostella TaxID=51655 RepID=A0A8S4DP19_PLUXY|nr:unnamed protein product [Plutella xylostella]